MRDNMNQGKKVLHLIDSGGFYGAESMLLELVREQRKQGLDAWVGSIGAKTEEIKEIESRLLAEDCPVKVFRMTPGPNLLGAFKILSWAKKQCFHLIHCHGYKDRILVCFIPAFLRRIPIVTTLHGWTSSHVFSKLYLYELLDRYCLRFFRRVFLVNESMKELPALGTLPQCRLVVINNGISLDSKHEPDEEWFQLKESKGDCVYVGSIGRLSPEKGYDLLVKAFAEVDLPDVKCKLIILGDGDERDILKKMVQELGLEEKVVFVGYKSNASSYLSILDIYVNSSRTEGLPMTLLEAMRVNIPIIAPRIESLEKLLDQGLLGELFESGEHSNLADVLSNKITRLDDHTKANRAKAVFESNYTSERMASSYMSEYVDLYT